LLICDVHVAVAHDPAVPVTGPRITERQMLSALHLQSWPPVDVEEQGEAKTGAKLETFG